MTTGQCSATRSIRNHTTGEKTKHNVYCTRLLRPNQFTKLCRVHYTDVKDVRRAGQVVRGRRHAHTRARAVVLSTRTSCRPLRPRAYPRTRTHTHALARAHTNDVRPLGQVTTDRSAKPDKTGETVTRPSSTGNHSTIPSCK